MKTPEEILDQYLDDYPWIYSGKENAIKAMKLYAKLYHDSEVKKLNIPAVVGRSEQFTFDDMKKAFDAGAWEHHLHTFDSWIKTQK
jgi:hypothetical protein